MMARTIPTDIELVCVAARTFPEVNVSRWLAWGGRWPVNPPALGGPRYVWLWDTWKPFVEALDIVVKQQDEFLVPLRLWRAVEVIAPDLARRTRAAVPSSDELRELALRLQDPRAPDLQRELALFALQGGTL